MIHHGHGEDFVKPYFALGLDDACAGEYLKTVVIGCECGGINFCINFYLLLNIRYCSSALLVLVSASVVE